jgi:hypothetical protein
MIEVSPAIRAQLQNALSDPASYNFAKVCLDYCRKVTRDQIRPKYFGQGFDDQLDIAVEVFDKVNIATGQTIYNDMAHICNTVLDSLLECFTSGCTQDNNHAFLLEFATVVAEAPQHIGAVMAEFGIVPNQSAN